MYIMCIYTYKVKKVKDGQLLMIKKLNSKNFKHFGLRPSSVTVQKRIMRFEHSSSENNYIIK